MRRFAGVVYMMTLSSSQEASHARGSFSYLLVTSTIFSMSTSVAVLSSLSAGSLLRRLGAFCSASAIWVPGPK